jgi:hypothetical protein
MLKKKITKKKQKKKLAFPLEKNYNFFFVLLGFLWFFFDFYGF